MQLATAMTTPSGKVSVQFNLEELSVLKEALELRMKRLGESRKGKVSPLLRELALNWAKQEKQMSVQGTLFEQDGPSGTP